jgi:hypothetical protein
VMHFVLYEAKMRYKARDEVYKRNRMKINRNGMENEMK